MTNEREDKVREKLFYIFYPDYHYPNADKGRIKERLDMAISLFPQPLSQAEVEKLISNLKLDVNFTLEKDDTTKTIMIRLNEVVSKGLAHAISTHFYKPVDNIFIKHIQAHLKPDEEVICKICGKTAKEIINGKL